MGGRTLDRVPAGKGGETLEFAQWLMVKKRLNWILKTSKLDFKMFKLDKIST